MDVEKHAWTVARFCGKPIRTKTRPRNEGTLVRYVLYCNEVLTACLPRTLWAPSVNASERVVGS